MALFDLLGRRWVMRVIWELHQADRPLTFRELRGHCSDISSSVLTRRLQELSDAHLVEHSGEGYVLTPLALEFVVRMQPLLDWSRDWAAHLDGDRTT